jgi:hypothetical protein
MAAARPCPISVLRLELIQLTISSTVRTPRASFWLRGGGWFTRDGQGLPTVFQAMAATGVPRPNVLVITTPTSTEYTETNALREILGTKDREPHFRVLRYGYDDPYSAADVNTLFTEWKPRVIVGLGGEFLWNLDRLGTTGLGAVMMQAADTPGIEIVGSSTWYLNWFRSGFSTDAKRGEKSPEEPLPSDALGLLPADGCAHYDEFYPDGCSRAEKFRHLLESRPVGAVGVGTTRNCTLRIAGGLVWAAADNNYDSVHRVHVVEKGRTKTLILKAPNNPVPYQEFFYPALAA